MGNLAGGGARGQSVKFTAGSTMGLTIGEQNVANHSVLETGAKERQGGGGRCTNSGSNRGTIQGFQGVRGDGSGNGESVSKTHE